MKSNETRILGVLVKSRQNNAVTVQNILTSFGCSIKTRLGLHDVNENVCSSSGLILLELTGDINEMSKLENELLKVDGVEVQRMIFNN
ncbi:MAG: hypothetical protein Q8907_08495 [Bacteroidota bacterium]|nr:hypothetical protein [Bacteroidota bacterium]MDP4274301.1 hypothetical protein [Bacteroidota bacterium]